MYSTGNHIQYVVINFNGEECENKCIYIYTNVRVSQWFRGKEFACKAGATGDVGLIPVSGRSPGGEHGNPLQSSCLEGPMDRRAKQATVHSVTKSQI